MITPQQKRWLASLEIDPSTGKLKRDGVKYSVYIGRIQKRIDKELEVLLWLSIHHPQIYLNEGKEYRDSNGKVTPHKRLKELIKVLCALNPKMEVEMVLKQALSELDIPEGINSQ